jgi:F-type H+-transporting ATPase subunit gamma
MTERLADVAAHVHAVRQIGAVVNAMRGLSGARAQKGRVLLPAIRAYADVSGKAMARVLPPQNGSPDRHAEQRANRHPEPATLIVFGAQQGFAGAFADQVLDRATAEIAGTAHAHAHIMMVGARSAVIALTRGITPAWTIAMPDRPTSITGMATELADALYAHIAASGAAAVAMIAPVWTGAAGVSIERRPLLPLDTARFRLDRRDSDPPLTTLPAPLLIERLTEEYVFAQICEAAMEAYVAENQARVEAMVAAKRHIDEQLDDLDRRAHQVRQDEITDEVIELAAARRKKPVKTPV